MFTELDALEMMLEEYRGLVDHIDKKWIETDKIFTLKSKESFQVLVSKWHSMHAIKYAELRRN